TQGDFRYYLYQNNGEVDDILPDYVLLFEYTGKEKVGSAYGLITFAGEGGAAGTGIILEPSDRYCAVIDMDNVNIYDVDKDTGEKRPMSEEDYNYEYSKAIYELRLYPFSPDNAPDTDVDEAEAIAEITIEFDR
ncbi:MAG: hypothetical protein IJH77_04265, partial [Mogibacterium sp.]|nr:hypothetical protein [Mogibacterium sp.]